MNSLGKVGSKLVRRVAQSALPTAAVITTATVIGPSLRDTARSLTQSDVLAPEVIEMVSPVSEVDLEEEFTVTSADGLIPLELSDGEGIPVLTSFPRLSRTFGLLVTFVVGVAAASPLVLSATERFRRRTIDHLPIGEGGDVPVVPSGPGNTDVIPVPANLEPKRVSFCSLHENYFETITFCCYCRRENVVNSYSSVLFSDVPTSLKFGPRLIPQAVFPPYLFDSPHYELFGSVLVSTGGCHKPRVFIPRVPLADVTPFHTDFRFVLGSGILIRDASGGLLGLPVYSSYGYLEGYSPHVV